MRTVPTPAAREDILAQFHYYALHQGVPDVGFRFLDAVEAAIAHVGEMPAIGAPQHFGSPALAGVRAWPVPGFEDIRLCYLATADVLLIVRVLHDRRDVRRILQGAEFIPPRPLPRHELLHPPTPGVDDIHSTVLRDCDVVREPELPIVIAETAEAHDQLPVGIHDGNTRTVCYFATRSRSTSSARPANWTMTLPGRKQPVLLRLTSLPK